MLQAGYTLAKRILTSLGAAPHASTSPGEHGIRKGRRRRRGVKQHGAWLSGSAEDAPPPVTPVCRPGFTKPAPSGFFERKKLSRKTGKTERLTWIFSRVGWAGQNLENPVFLLPNRSGFRKNRAVFFGFVNPGAAMATPGRERKELKNKGKRG